jgi:hypothetical protein
VVTTLLVSEILLVKSYPGRDARRAAKDLPLRRAALLAVAGVVS